MTDFVFTGKQLKEYGWDGNLDTLESFKKTLKNALELGWNPEEISLQVFNARLASLMIRTLRGEETSPDDLKEPLECEVDKNSSQNIQNDELEEELEDDFDDDNSEDDIDSRRRRAEEAGWDEEEMDLDEFEDYFF